MVGGGGATMCLSSRPVTLELPLSSPQKGRKKNYALPSEELFAGRGLSQEAHVMPGGLAGGRRRCLELNDSGGQ
jgi:hypothetical protein